MAHPKSRVSKTRKRKRRTHKKLTAPHVAICPTTGEPHLYHRAYEVDGNLYYRGKVLANLEQEED
ncbi:MAG: 50S ribosomal protein L32 [Saprospiraceae bacterium]|nr:50S ribosomal protein L32 [Saprospiraceae bacterium]